MLPALALDLAFTVTASTLRGRVGHPSPCSSIETDRARSKRREPATVRTDPAADPAWGRVRRMFAHPTQNQNWWWTAHPAAH
ncbi:trp operon leader peptide [Streptomyces sp. BH-SS-21]|nr:trp operon leader peptide [Streptomyces liliiviolaceus]